MRHLVLAVGMLVVVRVTATQAAPMTLAYDFTASGFQVYGAGAVPVDPVVGSFSLTFDPSKPAQVTNIGLSVTGLNIPYDRVAEYGYSGVFNDLAIGDDIDFPGGHSVGGSVDPSRKDFSLYISLLPVVEAISFSYSQATGAVYVSENVVLTSAAVPEPASFALLGSYILSLAVVLTTLVFRRRWSEHRRVSSCRPQ